MNKTGDITGIFLFVILTFIIAVVSVILLYTFNTINEEMLDWSQGRQGGSVNATEVVENTLSSAVNSFQILKWASFFIIMAMVIAVIVGSYLVNTRPIFFVPYIFVLMISIVTSIEISNVYERLANTSVLNETFLGFGATNWVVLHLPIWVTVVGFLGAIIMYVSMVRGRSADGF